MVRSADCGSCIRSRRKAPDHVPAAPAPGQSCGRFAHVSGPGSSPKLSEGPSRSLGCPQRSTCSFGGSHLHLQGSDAGYEEQKREQTPPRLALCPGPRGCRFQAQQEVAVAVGLSALPVHRSLASEGGRGSRVWRAMEWLAESHRVAEGLRVRGALTVHREPVHEATSHPALRILKPL